MSLPQAGTGGEGRCQRGRLPVCPVLGLGMARAACMEAAGVWGSSRTPWAGLGSKAPLPPQEQGCPHGQVWPGSAVAGHGILVLPRSRAHPATQIPISRPDSPPRPLIRTGPEHAGHPFPVPPAASRPPTEAPTPLTAPGAGPFAGRTHTGSLHWDLAAQRTVSTERALGSAPPPARRAWALAGTAVPLLGQPAQGPSLGEVRVAPLRNLLPHGPAPAAFPGSHPGAGGWGAWQRLGEVSWPCGAVLRPLLAVSS